jgi:hypothetical protein
LANILSSTEKSLNYSTKRPFCFFYVAFYLFSLGTIAQIKPEKSPTVQSGKQLIFVRKNGTICQCFDLAIKKNSGSTSHDALPESW